MYYILLNHERRLSSPTLTVRPLRLLPIIYTVDNTQLARILPDYYIFGHLFGSSRFFLLLHVLQGYGVPSSPPDARAESSVDFRLHIFDTTAPPTNPKQTPQPTEWHHRRWAPDEPTTMKVMKVIQGSPGGWTITDAHLSPDNERLVSPVVRLLCLSANTGSFIPPL